VARREAASAALTASPIADGVVLEELDANGVGVLSCQMDGVSGTGGLLYFHGGGYRLGSARAFRGHASYLAAACGTRVVSVDYRLAPEHPFPAALDDAVAAYRWMLDGGADPARLVLGGDSAGGGLAAALLQRLGDDGLPAPAGTVLLSPWADLRLTAPSYTANAATDGLFSLESATEAAAMYLAGHPATDPLVSPVLADWTGRPPLLVHTSTSEVLRDDALELARAAGAAGVDVRLQEYADQPHVWHYGAAAGAPEALAALDDVGRFVRAVSGT
jgi:acetyl esterase/lipase